MLNENGALTPMHLTPLELLPSATMDPVEAFIEPELLADLMEQGLVEKYDGRLRRTVQGDVFNSTVREVLKASVRLGRLDGRAKGIKEGKLAAYTRAALMVGDHARSYAVEAEAAKEAGKQKRAARKLAAADALVEGGLAISLCIVADCDSSVVDDAEFSRAFARD